MRRCSMPLVTERRRVKTTMRHGSAPARMVGTEDPSYQVWVEMRKHRCTGCELNTSLLLGSPSLFVNVTHGKLWLLRPEYVAPFLRNERRGPPLQGKW